MKNRQWTRKTPHDSKAMSGTVVCPAANIPNASVLVVENGQFYVAPVVYQGVMDSVSFHGHIAEDIPPAPPRRVRGKTSVARGESGLGDAEVESSGFRSGGFGDAVPSEGLGDANSGGDGHDEDHDEYEGMVPDSVVEDSVVERLGVSSLQLRTLWCQEVNCRMCDTPRTLGQLETCLSCGTWQGKMLTREESEREAERLLKSLHGPSRVEVDNLLRGSAQGWRARARPCDRAAAENGTMGWTLGQYVYGSQAGITKETLKRPQLTRLLNKYIQQTVDASFSWSAIRVTRNYQAGPHVDCNEPGSMNVVVPISQFEGGRIWVKGRPQSDIGTIESRDVRGHLTDGYMIGGSREVAC